MVTEKKSKHGGARANAGRPKFAKNKKTIAAEMAQRNVIDELLQRLTEEEIQKLSPMQIMEIGMHLLLRSGNLTGAIATAEKLAPYVHPKIASAMPFTTLPEDMMPDVPPTPDEPGPENPIY
jgi:hypothetical protein